jgi:hypothetical protein
MRLAMFDRGPLASHERAARVRADRTGRRSIASLIADPNGSADYAFCVCVLLLTKTNV